MIHPETHKVTKENGRCPAIREEKCCWCQAKLGEDHDVDCVCRKRTVKMRVVIDYVDEVPESWTREDIERHFNEGSWCAVNVLAEFEHKSCLCDYATFKYIAEATADDEQDWKGEW